MTLVPAAAILVARRDAQVRAAVLAYLGDHPPRRRRRVGRAARARAHGAIGDPPRSRAGGAQTLVAVAALVGFGTKAGLVPLHAWLPRAHPVAPAPPVGADVGRDDQGRALRADPRRVRVARRDRRCGSASRCWRSGSLSALGGVLWALVQHDLKRLLAFQHDRERRDRRARRSARRCCSPARASPSGRRSRSPRRCCTSSTTRSSRRCCSSARARSSARSARSTSTASAGCCGACRGPAARSWSAAMAIAGLPPLNGFASEWLTLQSLLHVALDAAARRRARRRGRRWRGSRRPPALALLCFVKVVGLVAARRAAPAGGGRGARGRRWPMRAGDGRCSPALCVVLGLVPGLVLPDARRARARRPATARAATPGSTCPATGSLPTLGARGRARRSSPACSSRRAGRRRAAPAPDVGVRPAGRARAELDVGRLHQAAAARARGGAAPAPRARGRRGARAWCSGVALRQRGRRSLVDAHALRARDPRRAARRGGRAPAADRQRPHLRRATCWRSSSGLLALARTGALG